MQLDLRGAKTFNVGERVKVQLLAEMFNLFNRQNICNNVDNTFYASDGSPSPTFGTPKRILRRTRAGGNVWKRVQDPAAIPGDVLAAKI